MIIKLFIDDIWITILYTFHTTNNRVKLYSSQKHYNAFDYGPQVLFYH